jgi:heptosyltransferase III
MVKKILVSRVDNLGDVILTLPLAGCLRKLYPDSKITFLLKSYTVSIGKIHKDIDEILLWDELENSSDSEIVDQLKKYEFDMVIHVYPVKRIASICFKAKIPARLGTAHRLYHWRYCNKLSFFSRKSSDYHESQLNLKLLEPISASKSLDYGISNIRKYLNLNLTSFSKHFGEVTQYLAKDKFNLIIHPKSFGSALEWPLESYRELVESLDLEKYHIIVTGTKKEEVHLEMGFLNPLRGKVTSCVGFLNLEQLMALMLKADGIIAASTGPLHLGAILGLNNLGLFPNKRPMFPLRWIPIGMRTTFLLSHKSAAMTDITVTSVLKKISKWEKLEDQS